MNNKSYIICPVCGKHKFPIWEDNGTCICPYCGWGHDTTSEEHPSEVWGPNNLSLDDYKLRYGYYIAQNPKYHWEHDLYPEIPQIEECKCPVCGKFEFEELSLDDLYCGVKPSDVYCMSCGWRYSPKQTKSPDLKNDVNEMSLNEYRAWYAEKIATNPQYSYFEEMTENYVPTPHMCPVCGKYEFKDEASFAICPFCGWEDDGVQLDDPNFSGGANDLSLKQYRKEYREKIKLNPNYRWDKHH